MHLVYITAFLMVVAAALWCVGVFTTIVLGMRLRRFYPELAQRVAPGFLHKSIRTDIAGMKFILRREYAELDRPDVVRFCDFHRIIFLYFLFVFTCMIICFFCYAAT
ncbi:hypothetical protein P3T73_12425 [Kiritimatiellota bacterium B12222]|nr:hypothetical protein P3T73_12425 [Kiritimatiellota bacterium B12222]